jgi:putative endonuclease
MYYVYILRGLNNKHYIGSTSSLEKRIARHNRGGSIWTRKYKPWILTYKEEFENKIEAIRRERQIKSYKGENELKKLLNGKIT